MPLENLIDSKTEKKEREEKKEKKTCRERQNRKSKVCTAPDVRLGLHVNESILDTSLSPFSSAFVASSVVPRVRLRKKRGEEEEDACG